MEITGHLVGKKGITKRIPLPPSINSSPVLRLMR